MEKTEKKGVPKLKKTHFVDVADTSLRFDEYIDKTFGATPRNGRISRGGFSHDLARAKIRYEDNDDGDAIAGAVSNDALHQHWRRSGTPSLADEEARIAAEVERRVGKCSLCDVRRPHR